MNVTPRTFDNHTVFNDHSNGSPIAEPSNGNQAWAKRGSNWIGVTYVEGIGWLESVDARQFLKDPS